MDGRARLRHELGAALVAVVALVPFAAAAAPRTSSLSWTRLEGAESCIGTHDLAVKVEEILKRPAIVSPSESDRSIEGRVERTGDHFTSTIVVANDKGEEQGKRVLTSKGADCRELDDSMALVIALMIDPDALSAPKPHDPDPKPPDPNPPDPKIIVIEKTKTVVVPKEVAPPPPDYRIEGYLGGVTSIGITPLSGGFIAGVLFDPSFFGAFELDGVVTTSGNDVTPAISARFWKFEGGAYFCPLAGVLPDRGRALFQGAVCAGGQAGFVSASGDGLTDASTSLKPLVNGALRARLGGWFYPVSVTAGATFGIPILRETYAYVDGTSGSKTFFESAPVEGTFDVAIGLEFPAR
ncbi:MAG: hypothetical protein U0414_36195 [Polyangiaceae bacterium]